VNCSPADHGRFSQCKIIRCFRFEALGTGGSGKRTQLAVWTAGAERKVIVLRSCNKTNRENQCQYRYANSTCHVVPPVLLRFRKMKNNIKGKHPSK
jgi:hypothetical protein